MAPVLTLHQGSLSDDRTEATSRAATALAELAELLPDSDVLKDSCQALARCLERRVRQAVV